MLMPDRRQLWLRGTPVEGLRVRSPVPASTTARSDTGGTTMVMEIGVPAAAERAARQAGQGTIPRPRVSAERLSFPWRSPRPAWVSRYRTALLGLEAAAAAGAAAAVVLSHDATPLT